MNCVPKCKGPRFLNGKKCVKQPGWTCVRPDRFHLGVSAIEPALENR